VAAIPDGWQLGSESWSFHRQFYHLVGRPAAHGEYSLIRVQIQYHTAERMGRYHYRVTLPNGLVLIVRGNWHRLLGVERPDWTPQPPKAAALPCKAPKAERQAPPKPPARASTLTLNNPAAARAVAERLRRGGAPVGALARGPPP
jgi:hypothetical protein